MYKWIRKQGHELYDKYGVSLSLIVLAALGLRLVLLLTCLNSVNADQAVPGLMGMHILKGHFFNFIWEYKYAGALISYLAALNFKMLGVSVLSFKLTTFLFLIVNIVFSCKLAARLYGRTAGLLTGILFAVPPVFVTLFSVDTRGSYPETFAFGAVILYLTHVFSEEKEGKNWKLQTAVLGLISGFAFWVSPLITPYLLASWSVLFLVNRRSRAGRSLWLFFFFVLGAIPLVIYNIQHPLATFLSLGSRPFDVSRQDFQAGITTAGLLKLAPQYISNYLHGLPSALVNVLINTCSVFGLANPLMERFKLLKYVSCIIYLAPVAFYAAKARNSGRSHILIYLAAFSLLFALFGSLDSPRYLLTLWPAAAIFLAASMVKLGERSKALAISILIVVLSVNLGGTLMCTGIKSPPYEKLASWLSANDLRRGYAGYWTAYPVMFLSKEKIIVSPTLDLKTVHPRSKGVYPFYTDLVNAKEKVFYITNDNGGSVALFEKKMSELKVKFQKAPVPPFMVYHSFSGRVYPEDLDLPPSVSSVREPFFY